MHLTWREFEIASKEPEDPRSSAWLGHVPFLFWLVDAFRPRTYVELGTWHGHSFLAACQAMRDTGAPGRAYAVDTWQGDAHTGTMESKVHDALFDVVSAKYREFATLKKMTFDDALGDFDDNSIDLLHIDGLHTYDAVRRDFENWRPKMSDRGIILFHDICERRGDFGVWKLWDEVKGHYPSFAFEHSHGLGVLIVGSQAPEEIVALAKDFDEPAAGKPVKLFFQTLGERLTLRDRFAGLSLEMQKYLRCFPARAMAKLWNLAWPMTKRAP